MSDEYVLKSSDVPSGVYPVRFRGVEHTQHAEFGGGLRFTFEVTEGKYAGKTVTRVTGDKPTPRNAAGKVLAALAGAKPSDGLAVNVHELVGGEFQVVVGETENGFTRVNDILPSREEAPF